MANVLGWKLSCGVCQGGNCLVVFVRVATVVWCLSGWHLSAQFRSDNDRIRWFRPVVLNLGSSEPRGFGESVSGVRRLRDFGNKNKINKIHDTHFNFATTKGSINSCMELVGYSTFIKVNNHCISMNIEDLVTVEYFLTNGAQSLRRV